MLLLKVSSVFFIITAPKTVLKTKLICKFILHALTKDKENLLNKYGPNHLHKNVLIMSTKPDACNEIVKKLYNALRIIQIKRASNLEQIYTIVI